MSDSKGTYSLIFKAGLIVIVLSMVDKVMALAKEMCIAHRFGISAGLDVFNVAYALPGIVVLMVSGAFAAAFVPLYIEWTKSSSPEEADAHALGFLYGMLALFAALAVLGYVFSPRLFRMIGYGFEDDARLLGSSVEGLLMLFLFLEGAAIVPAALLHSRKRFYGLYLAPLFVNASIIAAVAVFTDLGIYALVWGTIAGTFLKAAFTLAAVSRSGFRLTGRTSFDRSHLRAFFLLMLPLFGGQLIANSNILIDQVMATQLSTGSVSALRYAYRINDLPIQVVVLGLSKAIFPYISEFAANKDRESLIKVFRFSLVLLGFITFPIIVVVAVHAQEIVTLLLQRGAFDLNAAQQTARTLVLYTSGLFFFAYTFINGVYFSALQDTMPLLTMGGVAIVLNALLNYVFMHLLGVSGIALSSSVLHGVLSVVFIVMLKKRLGFGSFVSLFSGFPRLILAGVCMAGFSLLLNIGIDALGWNRVACLIPSVTLTCSFYLAMVYLLRTEEIDTCFSVLKQRGSALKDRLGIFAG
ncbi:MAG: murein biosynthesis integral membrane protein MurJ [Acidobacteriota bacterium]